MPKPIVESLLSRLGINPDRLSGEPPYPCPVHDRHNRFLWPLEGGDLNLYFRCTHHNCHFVGTPVDLVGTVRNLDVRETLREFEPGGEFGDLFGSDQNQIVLHARTRAMIDQADLRRYLKDSKSRLSKLGQDLLMPLQSNGILPKYLLNTTCGMANTQLPAILRAQGSAIYENENVLLLPYYNGVEITHVVFLDPNTGRYELKETVSGANGIFLEREMSWPTVNSVVLCSSELDALRVLSGVSTVTSNTVNPIAVSSPEALLDLEDLQTIYMLSHQGAPLSLADVLGCWRVISHTDIDLQVVDLVDNLTSVDAVSLLQPKKRAQNVWHWVAGTLKKLWEQGRDELVDRLTETSINDADREFLLQELRQCDDIDPEITDVVECIRCAVQDQPIHEYIVRRDNTGYHIVLPHKKKLTNFCLHTSRYVQTPKGGVEAHCRLQIGGRILPKEIAVPYNSLKNGSRRLKHTLWKLLGDSGQQVQAPLHSINLPGFDWLDLLQAFDRAHYYQGVKQLGVNDNRVDFPNFFINTHTYSIEPQHNSLFVPDDALYVYSTIDDRSSTLDQYRQLFDKTHPSAVAMIGGLSHLIHQLVGCIHHGREFNSKHLLFPSSATEGSMWEVSFRQLCGLFSRSMMGIELASDKAARTQLDDYETLGALPLFARARGRNTHLEKWMETAHTPLILLTDPEASISLGHLHNTSSLQYGLKAFKEYHPSRIENETMCQLRNSCPTLIRDCLKTCDPGMGELETSIPAQIGYTWICKLLELKPKKAVLEMFEEHPPADWVDYIDAFFLALNRLMQSKKADAVELSRNRSAARDHLNSIGWRAEDGIWLAHGRVLPRINKMMEHPISRTKLETLLFEKKIGTDISRGGGYLTEIFIPMKEWNKRVDKRIRELRAETATPVLRFA